MDNDNNNRSDGNINHSEHKFWYKFKKSIRFKLKSLPKKGRVAYPLSRPPNK